MEQRTNHNKRAEDGWILSKFFLMFIICFNNVVNNSFESLRIVKEIIIEINQF